MNLNTERNLATRLSNSGRFERIQSIEHFYFASARSEWFAAWGIFYQRQRLTPVLGLAVGKQETSESGKADILAMLRIADQPETTLQKMAPIIYAAAREGDVDFFRNMGKAFRGHERSDRQSSFLAWNILCYWFAGLLWLMDAEAGTKALNQYTREPVTVDAYRKACARMKLVGYKAFATLPPVIAYHPRRRAYAYAPAWTELEPK